MVFLTATSCGDLGERRGHFVVVITKMKIMTSLEVLRGVHALDGLNNSMANFYDSLSRWGNCWSHGFLLGKYLGSRQIQSDNVVQSKVRFLKNNFVVESDLHTVRASRRKVSEK